MRRKLEDVWDYVKTWLIHKLGGKTAWEYKVYHDFMNPPELVAEKKDIMKFSATGYVLFDPMDDLDSRREIVIGELARGIATDIRQNGVMKIESEPDAYGENIHVEVQVVR